MRRKVYGSSRLTRCWFCETQATMQTVEGVPSCRQHTKQFVNIKCVCGERLEPCNGRYGFYFNCMRCGNLSESKVRAISLL